ncbi:hypothetical protein B4117_3082 [Bacillus mycoides]|nr:hypothetical protein B4117_3082 [Bacillus mycoides]
MYNSSSYTSTSIVTFSFLNAQTTPLIAVQMKKAPVTGASTIS